ncbi:MAG: peptidoglycan DD-metalloendopeptidase family protein [Candidatus Muiribacteriota bacterium]
MERIDLWNLNKAAVRKSRVKRRKYKLNKNRFITFFFLFILSVLGFLLFFSKPYYKGTSEDIYSEFDINSFQGAIDVYEINFEETSPQEVTLHISQDELEIMETREYAEVKEGKYIVRRGDSLWSIAQKTDLTVNELAQINRISPSRVLQIGEILNIDPSKKVKPLSQEPETGNNKTDNNTKKYNVRRGDSLWLIAQRFGLYVSTLQYANKITSSQLQVNQELKIPPDDIRYLTLEKSRTLQETAFLFNATLNEVKELNSLKIEKNSFSKNTRIKIPNNNPFFVNKTNIKKFNSSIASWPVNGNVSSPYGWRTHPVYGTRTFHNGIDIENSKGTSVRAASAGKVVFSSYKGNSGNLIIIQHKNGYQSIYAHLNEIKVKNGTNVKQNQVIGTLGNTGVSTAPHLHFGLRKDGKFENPMNILN